MLNDNVLLIFIFKYTLQPFIKNIIHTNFYFKKLKQTFVVIILLLSVTIVIKNRQGALTCVSISFER
jgi:hypothetical protein